MLVHTKGASGGAPWAIVLAGGEGVRLLPLVRQLCGMNGRNSLRKSWVGSRCFVTHSTASVSRSQRSRQ